MVSSTGVWGKAKSKPQVAVITVEEQMRMDYYLYAALNASEHNNHPQAFFLLELCYQIDSLNPTVCSMRGSYILSLYGKDKALPLLRRAYEGSPRDYWYRYAVTAYEAGKRNEAMKVIKTMEKAQPKDQDILELHEHILRHEHKYKQALSIRDKIDKLTGEPTIYSVITRYELLNESGAGDKALRVIDDYLERNPNDGRMRSMRADIDLKAARDKGDVQNGQRLFAQQMQSDDVTLRNKLKLLQANCGWLGYDADEQKRWLIELREQYPYEQEIYQALLDHEQKQGHTSAALEIGRTMLTMNPTDRNLREKIADLMRDDEKVTEEEVGLFIDESYDVLPDDPKWGYFKALRCWQRQDIDSVIIVLERAIRNADDKLMRVELLELYGDAQGHQQNYAKAFEAYEEVLKVVPSHIGVLNNYAWTLAISGGDLRKAEMMSQQTIQKEANNPTYLDTYAWILHLQGQDTLALFYIKKALENSTNKDSTIVEHYTIIQQSLQR